MISAAVIVFILVLLVDMTIIPGKDAGDTDRQKFYFLPAGVSYPVTK